MNTERVHFIDISQVAQLLGVCRRTVSLWHRAGKLPPAVPFFGRALKWRSDVIHHFIQSASPPPPEAPQQQPKKAHDKEPPQWPAPTQAEQRDGG